MIAVDTSALMAVVLREPERAAMLAALVAAERILISAGTMIEVKVVCQRRGGDGLVSEVEELIDSLGIEIVPTGEDEIVVASVALVRYGKGGGHPAQLNFGDLFSYALAKSRGIPLLFKGNDFTATDIVLAGPGSGG
jgi:ribonuclease VapC